MASWHSNAQKLKEAVQIAKDHGCVVKQVGKEYRLYRIVDERPVYVGARTSCGGIRRLVCQATGFV